MQTLINALEDENKEHPILFDGKSGPTIGLDEIHRFLMLYKSILFPGVFYRLTESKNHVSLTNLLHDLKACVETIICGINPILLASAETQSTDILNGIVPLKQTLKKDIDAIYNGDPAAESYEEVVLAYPSFEAIMIYRIAHNLHLKGHPLFARMCASIAHRNTGIDIHPKATIGESFCIDHGTGIVIGETAIIGHHVKLYQGVTIGALSVSKRQKNTKRHPTIEDHVTIYARTTILGGNTVIGAHSIIGGNVWLTGSVPPNSKVYAKALSNEFS
ncbi:MAG: serine acetyltransferase [Candidatus Margulisbacteria bacterium]|nr:serine acetyltransferase [Candidatus Margulisiibacteriota bacterium]